MVFKKTAVNKMMEGKILKEMARKRLPTTCNLEPPSLVHASYLNG
jgi:hypothetical protein